MGVSGVFLFPGFVIYIYFLDMFHKSYLIHQILGTAGGASSIQMPVMTSFASVTH